ncbi:MAG: glycosyltransferase family 4 protein [Rhodospirillales bacterium]|nr:glycosyltransferase family 4 protein [Rhodospirillales bacterium]MCB9996424.1 glycosyltransferase family 4 protein [Rhodospirillales bacterium]
MASRKPSVVFINRVYPPLRGATGRMLRDLARAFAEEGWSVTVVTTGPKARRDYDGPIRLVRVRAPVRAKKASSYIRVWFSLFWAALNQPKHDLVVTMTDPPLLVVAGRILASLKRSRHMHWCQDLYPDILPALGLRVKDSRMRFYQKLSRKAMKRCDKVVTIGRCMAKKLTHSGVEPGKVAVIPNWPDYELLPPEGFSSEARRRRVRQINGAKGARPFDLLLTDGASRKFRVLYSGNLGRAHPIDTVLGAAAILNEEHPEIEFVFVGDGPNYERLAAERSKRGLENVRLLPFQPASRLRELMESGDLHLITMKHESAGMLVPCKLYGALAVGRPCILVGPDDCETAQVIHDFKAGVIVPQGDARRLAEEIKRFRFSADDWFAAHEGASEAGRVFVPKESMDAWIRRAKDIVRKAA